MASSPPFAPTTSGTGSKAYDDFEGTYREWASRIRQTQSRIDAEDKAEQKRLRDEIFAARQARKSRRLSAGFDSPRSGFVSPPLSPTLDFASSPRFVASFKSADHDPQLRTAMSATPPAPVRSALPSPPSTGASAPSLANRNNALSFSARFSAPQNQSGPISLSQFMGARTDIRGPVLTKQRVDEREVCPEGWEEAESRAAEAGAGRGLGLAGFLGGGGGRALPGMVGRDKLEVDRKAKEPVKANTAPSALGLRSASPTKTLSSPAFTPSSPCKMNSRPASPLLPTSPWLPQTSVEAPHSPTIFQMARAASPFAPSSALAPASSSSRPASPTRTKTSPLLPTLPTSSGLRPASPVRAAMSSVFPVSATAVAMGTGRSSRVEAEKPALSLKRSATVASSARTSTALPKSPASSASAAPPSPTKPTPHQMTVTSTDSPTSVTARPASPSKPLSALPLDSGLYLPKAPSASLSRLAGSNIVKQRVLWSQERENACGGLSASREMSASVMGMPKLASRGRTSGYGGSEQSAVRIGADIGMGADAEVGAWAGAGATVLTRAAAGADVSAGTGASAGASASKEDEGLKKRPSVVARWGRDEPSPSSSPVLHKCPPSTTKRWTVGAIPATSGLASAPTTPQRGIGMMEAGDLAEKVPAASAAAALGVPAPRGSRPLPTPPSPAFGGRASPTFGAPPSPAFGAAPAALRRGMGGLEGAEERISANVARTDPVQRPASVVRRNTKEILLPAIGRLPSVDINALPRSAQPCQIHHHPLSASLTVTAVYSISSAAQTPLPISDRSVFHSTETIAVVLGRNEGLVVWHGRDSLAGPVTAKRVKALVDGVKSNQATTEALGGSGALVIGQGMEPAWLLEALCSMGQRAQGVAQPKLEIRRGTRRMYDPSRPAVHRLRAVGARGAVVMEEKELEGEALVSGEAALVVDAEGSVVVWEGRWAKRVERDSMRACAKVIAGGKAVQVLREGINDEDWKLRTFGGAASFASSNQWRHKAFLLPEPLIWRVDTSLSRPVMAVPSPTDTATQLPDFHVALIDTGLELFVLIPSAARHRRTDIALAILIAKQLSSSVPSGQSSKRRQPFRPAASVLIFPSVVPADLLASARSLDLRRLNAGIEPKAMNLYSLEEANEQLVCRSLRGEEVEDEDFLPLGVGPDIFAI